MKKIVIICTLLSSLMLFSFQQNRKIVRLQNGNYLAKNITVMKELDAKSLSDMTSTSASESTVVHTKVYKDVVDQTVWKHKDAKLQLDRVKMEKVKLIMNKY